MCFTAPGFLPLDKFQTLGQANTAQVESSSLTIGTKEKLELCIGIVTEIICGWGLKLCSSALGFLIQIFRSPCSGQCPQREYWLRDLRVNKRFQNICSAEDILEC